MHALFFGIKRAHWRIVALTDRLLRDQKVPLTAARFDMLRIVGLYDDEGVTQRNITYLLGVSAATVSRMLNSLEDLGFVHRERDAHDRRCVRVTLTKEGFEVLASALFANIDFCIAERMALSGVTGNRKVPLHSVSAKRKLANCEKLLAQMRRIYFDPTPVRHPWRGGSFVITDADGGLRIAS